MQSQIYLSDRLVAQAELSQNKKGKLIVKLLLETELVRPTTQGAFQAEAVTIPVSFFSREAEAVRECQPGDYLVIGAHLYGTRFEAPDGSVKRGVQIVADQILQRANRMKEVYNDSPRT
jgi:single-stranded DNA-binding protein